jgi:hypothetical protein
MNLGWVPVAARNVRNVALAYAIAAVVTLLFIAAATAAAPAQPGPGILGCWVFEMCLLAFGAPAVAIVLFGLDLVVRDTGRPRRLAIVISLVPALAVGVIAIFEPGVAYLVAWLTAVGLILGLTMSRLPSPLLGPPAIHVPAQ